MSLHGKPVSKSRHAFIKPLNTPSRLSLVCFIFLLAAFLAKDHLSYYSLTLPAGIFLYGSCPIDSSLSMFITSQRHMAFKGVIENIGSSKTNSSWAAPGVVVASPSKSNPDYFYTWTRDSALAMKALVDTLIADHHALELKLASFVYAQAQLQTVSNPSGDLSDGDGLGEPKFNVDESAFTGSWGRPQRDGPALRAITLIAYSNWLLARGQNSTVISSVWPIVVNDLAYIGEYWNSTTFDLWEEVKGSSFFTTAVQHRALIGGNSLAEQIGKSCPACVSQSPQVLCFLQSFWNEHYILANVNSDNGRSGKDVNTLLASIHTFDPSAGCDDVSFQPCSPRVLANHKAVVDSFRSIYAINVAIPRGKAVAIGRYPEDIYQGGNPWYLTTLAAAELLYAAHTQLTHLSSITITPLSLPFFTDLLPSTTLGTYNSSTQTYPLLLTALRTYADGFLKIVQKYTPPTGLLAEQFSRHNGTPVSAANLTWSYAAFLTAVARREGSVPAAWGAANSRLPSKCEASSAKGTYKPACDIASIVSTTFFVEKETVYGETLYIAGSASELGRWDVDRAVEMGAEGYTAQEPVWSGVVRLRAGMEVEYKYLLKEVDGGLRWEEGGNRVFRVPRGCNGRAVVRDGWR